MEWQREFWFGGVVGERMMMIFIHSFGKNLMNIYSIKTWVIEL